MSARTRTLWTFAITSVAVFMATLDNLVVTTALPVIRKDLHATLASLEWTVNAYTLTFAVLLLTGAALGDRFGRRRMFVVGLAIFTLASAAAALAPSAGALIAARAAQGVGGAIITPLTLTILSAGVPANRRGAFIGAWSGIAGLAVALGPVVGGAVVSGISWHWIFWLNVPIGIVLIPLALRRLEESHGPAAKLDLPGVALASAGLTGIVWGLVRGNGQGWASAEIVTALVAGAIVFALFILWELSVKEPMLPMRFFKNRVFTLANVASLFMFFGMFGSIFLLSQFFQIIQGYSPLGSGVRILPWTIMPLFVAPVGGARDDRGYLDADHALLAVGRAVCNLGYRHGDVLGARRERCALGGEARGARSGVRGEQRHPRARRSLRRGCARVRVLVLRGLPHAGDVRQRDECRGRDRRRRGRSRRGGSVRNRQAAPSGQGRVRPDGAARRSRLSRRPGRASRALPPASPA